MSRRVGVCCRGFQVLVAEDVIKDERFADDPLVLEKGIRFYAGAPLRASAGVIIGVLCVIEPSRASSRKRIS